MEENPQGVNESNLFIYVFRQNVIQSKLLEYLGINDVYALRRTCTILNTTIGDDIMWGFMHRSHFTYSPRTLYKQSHLQQYICGNETRIGHEYFVCTNSPVYRLTVCRICSISERVCGECIRREVGDRVLCEECNEYIIVCETCHHANPKFVLNEEFRACNSCYSLACTKHYLGENNTCNICLNVE